MEVFDFSIGFNAEPEISKKIIIKKTWKFQKPQCIL